MSKKWIKVFLINAVVLIAANIGLVLLSNVILLTLCNAVFGADHGLYACNTLIRICLPITIGSVIIVSDAKDRIARIEYLKTISKEQYKAKEDLTAILKDKDFWAEFVIFAFLFVIMLLISEKPVWMFPLSIPLFLTINLMFRICLHKHWLKSQIRTQTKSTIH